MVAIFLTPAYAPFAIAFVVMMGIGLIEAIGLGLGHLDLDGDMAVDGDSGGVLDWLGLGGELPVLIWLTSLLGCFTLVGIAVQQAATASLGAPLHWNLAAGGAVVVGGLLNTLAANGLARLMPGFETTVISSTDLLRRRGIILEGGARRGQPVSRWRISTRSASSTPAACTAMLPARRPPAAARRTLPMPPSPSRCATASAVRSSTG